MIWVKRIPLGLLVLIVFLIITVATLLYTSAGVKLAVWGAQKALPALSVGSSSGALLKGFQLNLVKYRDELVDLAADNVNLKLDDRCFFISEVCISELGLSGIRFSLPELPPSEADTEEPASEPVTDVVMPLPIRIERVRLDDIALDILGNKLTWQQFSTAAEIEGSHLVLKPTDWQGIELTLAPTEQDKAQADDKPSSESVTLPEVILPMSFDIQRLTVREFKLNGDIPQQVNLLELVASAKSSDIAISKFVLDIPQAKLQATADVSLTGDYPLSLDANADIKMEPLHDHQVALNVSGSLAKLVLDARLKGTLDALVSGQLSPLDPKLPFDLVVSSHHLQWPIETKPEFEVADTLVSAKGSLDGYKFDLKSKIDGEPMPSVAVSLSGQGDLNTVSLEALKIETLGGTIAGKANASWKDALTWQGELDFSHIQPGLEWPEADGDLSGKLRTSGGLTEQGGWFVALPELAVDGVVMKQAFTLNGEFDAKDLKGKGDIQLITRGLTLKHGPNGLTARGKLTKEWAMSAQIDAPDLAQSLPGLRGRVFGQVDLSGIMAEPELDLVLNGNALGWQDLASLQAFELKGKVTPMPALKADVSLYAADGEYDAFKLDDLRLSFRGSEEKHTLTLDVNAQPVSAELALSGRLDRKTGWQGSLEQAAIDTEVGLWTLNHPTKLGYSLKTELAHIAAHCWQQSQSALCLTEDLEAGTSGHAKLAVNNFEFDLIDPYLPEFIVVKGVADANLEAAWAPGTSPFVKALIKLPTGSVTQELGADQPPLTVGWDKITVNAEIKDDVLNADWLIAITDNGNLSGEAQITQLMAEQQLKAKVNIDRLMLGIFEPVIKDYHQFDGQVDANLSVTGPVMHPAVNGQLLVTKVKAIGREVPFDIEQADIRATFSGYNATLEGEVITPDGKLQVRGKGDWQDLANWKALLDVDGRELEIHLPPMLALKVSPALTIAASPNKAEITGNIAIPWGRIKVDQLPESAVSVSDDEILLTDDLQPVDVEQKMPFDLTTNILVKIGNDVNLSAFGLNAGLVGELNVRQKDKGPLVYGEVNLQDGTYRSFGQELVIRKGQILFNGPADQPYLSIEAIRNPNNIEDDVVAGIRVRGPADAPRIDIFSDPAMAQQNALSYLLRGKNLDSESGDSGSAMTTALISMGIAKSGQLVGNVGEAFGVQDLALDTAGAGDGSQVTISGYIAPGLQVKYGVGIFNSVGEFTVRYRLMKDLYVEAVSGLDSAVDLLYQFEFD
ncbi:translocation/assembly module TamB domain-containing protein [Photobacterium sp.]|uniref:autotransporter assembly complex protein TamB n=1 Tax=Photobacterium sp. TaxID=660 RepID=UPI00299EC098|nr:translocation/assembly module TamB domain-containing protein [Photobacterium sp.]MDX1303494.1 translocation/assembly module TamB domain-containing protein [Photobacterium sp.]